MLTNRTKLYTIQEMQIEKRLEKLKKGRAKDSVSKLKVKACLNVLSFCIDTVNIIGFKKSFCNLLDSGRSRKVCPGKN